MTRRRASVTLDKYAVMEIGDEHGLDATTRLMLVVVTLLAESHGAPVLYRATVWELASQAGTTAKTARKALDPLVDAGLVDVLSDFGSNRAGELMLSDSARARLVVESAGSRAGTSQISAVQASSSPGGIALHSRSIRADRSE